MSGDATGDWHLVAKTSEITDETPKAAQVGKISIGIYRLGEAYYAIDDICTHEYAPLTEGYVDGEVVECPIHGALFNIRSGEAVAPPAKENLRTFRVKVEGEDIYVEVPPA